MVMGAVGQGVGSLHGEDEPRVDGVLRALVGEGRGDSACAVLPPCPP